MSNLFVIPAINNGDANIVSVLEWALTQARAGEATGFALVLMSKEDATYTTSFYGKSTITLLGAVEVMKDELLAVIRDE